MVVAVLTWIGTQWLLLSPEHEQINSFFASRTSSHVAELFTAYITISPISTLDRTIHVCVNLAALLECVTAATG